MQVGTATDWKSAIAGNVGSFSVGLKTDGSLWTWGSNTSGQLGDGTTTTRTSPARVGTSTWLAASAGSGNVVAIKSDGTLWAWGSNLSGQLGDSTTSQRNSPVQIGLDNRWTSVAGYTHTVATKSDGTLWAWGNDLFGQLGDAVGANRLSPAQVGTSTGWSSVTPLNSANHSLALKADGSLWRADRSDRPPARSS